MDFYSLFELYQIKAIHSAIDPTLDSIWRIKCRQYSEKFHTPLHVVMNELDPIFVLENLYEEQYSPSIIDEELEELLDKLYTIKDPTYSRMSKEETEDLIDAVLNKEMARIGKKKEQIELPAKQEEKSKIKTKSGGMDFSQLEKLEASSEANKSGFEE